MLTNGLSSPYVYDGIAPDQPWGQEQSDAHRQIDSKTIACDVTLQPGEEKTIAYTAHYTW